VCPASGEDFVLGNTSNGVANINSYGCATQVWNMAGPEETYSFTSSTQVSVELRILTLGSGQFRLALIEELGSGCTEVDCIDEGTVIYFTATAGTTYYVVADTLWNSPGGAYRIGIECPSSSGS